MSASPIAFLLLLACPFCSPGLPNGDPNQMTQTPPADDSGPVDTSPPDACAQPEIESNNSYSDANEIEMEHWACGYLETSTDSEFLTFESPYDGWIKMRLEAASIGSSADMRLLFGDNSSQYVALNLSQRNSTDPRIVAPIPGGIEWYAILSEQYGGYGEDYFWEFHASMVKEPTDWDFEEEESNNSLEEGESLESGERVFGQLESGSDQDWFLIEVPEEDIPIVLSIEAQEHHSPLHAELSLYKPDGTRVRRTSSGGTAYDQDPYIEYTSTQAGTWGVLVQVDSNDQSAGVGGSQFYWYVLQAEIDEDEDTGN